MTRDDVDACCRGRAERLGGADDDVGLVVAGEVDEFAGAVRAEDNRVGGRCSPYHHFVRAAGQGNLEARRVRRARARCGHRGAKGSVKEVNDDHVGAARADHFEAFDVGDLEGHAGAGHAGVIVHANFAVGGGDDDFVRG